MEAPDNMLEWPPGIWVDQVPSSSIEDHAGEPWHGKQQSVIALPSDSATVTPACGYLGLPQERVQWEDPPFLLGYGNRKGTPPANLSHVGATAGASPGDAATWLESQQLDSATQEGDMPGLSCEANPIMGPRVTYIDSDTLHAE